jgi:hypothetical protein
MDSLIFAHVYYDEGHCMIPVLLGGFVHQAFVTNDEFIIMALLKKRGIPMTTKEIVIEMSANQYNLH